MKINLDQLRPYWVLANKTGLQGWLSTRLQSFLAHLWWVADLLRLELRDFKLWPSEEVYRCVTDHLFLLSSSPCKQLVVHAATVEGGSRFQQAIRLSVVRQVKLPPFFIQCKFICCALFLVRLYFVCHLWPWSAVLLSSSFIALYDGRICQWEGTIIKHI